MKTKLILGGPGCGKTTRLLNVVEEEMASVAPDQIAFVAYTKIAAEEAKKRAATKFGLNVKRDFPWFRTIHSLAYNQVGVMRDEVMQKRDWYAFGKLIGEQVSGGSTSAEDIKDVSQITKGDRMLTICTYARDTLMTLQESWELHDDLEVGWHEIERFDSALKQWKDQNAKLDFTDMLEMYGVHCAPMMLDVAIVDEAQDLTPLQWTVIDKAFRHVKRLYVGGDDDQAIYTWSGADIKRFMAIEGEKEVLPHSHRMPHEIFIFSQDLAKRISERYEKNFLPTDHRGSIQWYHTPEQVDLFTEGTWLLLARNRYMLKRLEGMVRSNGLLYRTKWGTSVDVEQINAIYGWEDLRAGRTVTAAVAKSVFKFLGRKPPRFSSAEPYTKEALGLECKRIWHEALREIPPAQRVYYVACLRRKENLRREPNIRIDTIHGVKGAEADHVLLMTDLSFRTKKTFDDKPDDEHRVFYVGVTRARRSLHLIEPQGISFYPF